MRVISMQKGGNVKEVFSRFANAIMEVEKSVKVSFSPSFLSTVTSPRRRSRSRVSLFQWLQFLCCVFEKANGVCVFVCSISPCVSCAGPKL
jgi:hypothetical protein